MRLTTLILFSGIALACIPGCASAQKITHGDGWIKHCTQAEGYIDCNHVYPTAYSSKPAPRQPAYGSLWRPKRARQPR
jgi:hypothetical protein